MNKNEKITVGWQIPPDLKDKFIDFCKGKDIQENCAAALWVYMKLSIEVRELAKLEIKGFSFEGSSEFWDKLGQAIRLGIKVQLNNLQTKPKKK